MIRLNSGIAVLKDITFSGGTIEFDVNTIGRGAPGIAFRQQDEGNFELLYVRPDPACPAFQACVQYTPQTHGVLLWDLFPQYQAREPLRENGWNHIKMVISGRRMNWRRDWGKRCRGRAPLSETRPVQLPYRRQEKVRELPFRPATVVRLR